MSRKFVLLAATLPLAILSGCFTGVESTPKITYADVRKEGIRTTAEQEYSAHFVRTPLTQWPKGKEFLVESPKIGLVVGSKTFSYSPTKGSRLIFEGIRPARSLTGVDMVEVLLSDPAHPADTLTFRSHIEAANLTDTTKLSIPFTVDVALLQEAARWLVGNDYYLTTSLRYDSEGNALHGRKFVRVTVSRIVPGDSSNPIGIDFVDDRGEEATVWMSATDSSSARPFYSLFSLSDPRTAYPTITDEVWENIVNSRVALGMTRAECRLALGSPSEVDRGRDYSSAYERWSYPDGVYLIFQDGILTVTNK